MQIIFDNILIYLKLCIVVLKNHLIGSKRDSILISVKVIGIMTMINMPSN